MNAQTETARGAVALLRRPLTIRERCGQILTAGEAGELRHFEVDTSAMAHAVDRVVDEIRLSYPDLDIPYHSRWRHFVVGGVDRWEGIAAALEGDAAERLRTRFDLAVISVLLDAGAGSRWAYRDARNGALVGRSEGLALASLEMFAAGLFSSDPRRPLRAEAAALAGLDEARLAAAFQVEADNPLEGMAGRAALLRRLGDAIASRPELFGSPGRVGNLADHLRRRNDVAAPDILAALLDGLAPIWPGRLRIGGRGLGDVWRHPAAHGPGLTNGLVPFHKLTQWLTYSLVEPFEEAGVAVGGIDELTGLAEYRNGGLFIDTGVLVARDPSLLAEAQQVDAEAVIEWRALTVALLDRLAASVRQRLGLTASALPLAKVLQGGTWTAGRRIARDLRHDGGPPIRIVSDGTVF
ncbi:MAG: URC4/urg3 family protein [Alphaproteobacteria bacterium]